MLIPKGRYKGQKLIKLVSTKTAENTSKTIPKTPEITPVKNKTPTTTATSIRMALSINPIFFFIFLILRFKQIYGQSVCIHIILATTTSTFKLKYINLKVQNSFQVIGKTFRLSLQKISASLRITAYRNE